MAVTLRMKRKGTRHRPFYHIVATDSRKPRDGAFIEQIGEYDPTGDTHLRIDEAAASRWLAVGATQSKTVQKLLKRAGVGRAAPSPAAS
jgi:small subunit ribosomal protein S16